MISDISTPETLQDQVRDLQARIRVLETRLHLFPAPSISHSDALAIARSVANYYNVSWRDMLSPARPQRIAWPRMVAMYVIRHTTNLTCEQIRTLFRKRDHGSSIYAVRAVENRMQTEPKFRDQVLSLLAMIDDCPPGRALSPKAPTTQPI